MNDTAPLIISFLVVAYISFFIGWVQGNRQGILEGRLHEIDKDKKRPCD